MIGIVIRFHTDERILLRQLLFTKRSPVGQGDRLFQTESRSFGMMVGSLVHRHADALLQGRLLQGDGEGDERLVALHRHPIGLCMKERSLFFGFGQGAVGQRETHPYLHAPSAGTHQGRESLWQECRLRLHEFRFCQSRKVVYFHQYDTVVLLELPATILRATELRHGIDAWNLVQMDEPPFRPLQGRQTFPQLRDVFPFRLLHDFLQECFHGAGAPHFGSIFLSDDSYFHVFLLFISYKYSKF